jgi:hypothetical protein
LSVLVFALTVMVATAVDVAVARFMAYARSHTLSPSRWLLGGLAVILLGIPILSCTLTRGQAVATWRKTDRSD